MNKYFTIVIGAGAGGLVIAIGAARAGKQVLLIERGNWGGDCTNFGCIPSKTLIARAEKKESADLFPHIRAIVQGVRQHEEPEALENIGVHTVTGKAHFVDPHTVQVEGEKFSAQHIVIATGSKPHIPDIEGLESTPFLTNETIFSLDALPASMAVLGGGPIGCELAQAFAKLGTQVTLIHRGPYLLKKEEPEARKVIQEQLEKDGVKLLLDHQTQSIKGRFIIDDTIEVQQLLVATGRVPHLDLNLEAAQIAYSDRGIRVDKYGRTSQRHIFAVGDVTGGAIFTHAAENQARTVLTTLLLPWKTKIDKQPIPRATYTDPEVASFGPLKEEAEALFGSNNLRTYHVPLSENDRAVTAGRAEGFVQVITKKMSSKIVGATIVAPRAGEMLPELSLAAKEGVALKRLAKLIHPYPTYNLAIRKCGDLWLTEVFLPWLRHPFKGFNWKKFIPIAVIIIVMIVAYAFDVQRFFTIDMLKQNHSILKQFVKSYPIVAPLSYMVIYAVATALSLPGGALLSIIGGFLFPIPLSSIYVLVGATVGACLIFLAAKSAFGEVLHKKAGPFLKKMEKGFQKNAWSYLLFLRFVPIFPFWLVNIAPAFFSVSFFAYLWTTVVGIAPGVYAFTQAGAGLGAILENDEPFSLGAIFNPQIRIALIAIGIVALAPIFIKKFMKRREK